MTKFFDEMSFRQNFDFNPFVPNAHFSYFLKTLENHKIFCFQGVENGCIGKKLR